VSRGALLDMEESRGLEGPLCLEFDTSKVPPLPPQEIEALLTSSAGGQDRERIIVALVKRIVELQDQTSEEELLGMVSTSSTSSIKPIDST